MSASVGIVHNMYDMDKIWYHQQAARCHRYIYETEFDYQHIYRRPKNESNSLCTSICCVAQVQDTIYAIDEAEKFGHSYVNDYMYNWLLKDNGFAAPKTRLIDTALYSIIPTHRSLSGNIHAYVSRDYIKDDLASTSSNTFYLSTELSGKGPGIYATSSIVGIKYNTIYEIPNILQKYDDGEIVANTFKTKNQFDGKDWSMKKAGTPSNSMLSNARHYEGMYSCGSQLWLKWRDVDSYISSSSQPDVLTSPAATHVNTISAEKTDDVSSTVTFPQVEVVAAINRGIQSIAHKSTLYSLNLKTRIIEKFAGDSVIGELNTQEKAEFAKFKESLKLEIKNVIRKLAENVAPANCQLFSVTIDG